MPIEVHCPNPNCARIHLVKNRYAGMRGKCPACAAWMYVPVVGNMPSLVTPRPPELEAAAAAGNAEPPAPVLQAVSLAEVELPPVAEAVAEPARPRRHPRVEEEEEPALAVAEIDEEEPDEEKPRKYFSWVALLLVFLGMLALGAVAGAPFLPPPKHDSPTRAALTGIDPVYQQIIIGGPIGVAVVAALCILLGLVGRRVGIFDLALLYICLLGSSVLLVFALETFRRDLVGKESIINKLEQSTPPVKVDIGYQYYAMAGGAAAGCLFFLLAAPFMHRRWWSRVLGFFVLLFFPVLMTVWVFHKEIGLPTDLFPDRPW